MAPPPGGGAGGATPASPNMGHLAAANALVTNALKFLEKALPLAGATSDLGQSLMKAIQSLSKIVPPNSGSPGVEQSGMHKMMMEQKQEQPLLQMLRSQPQGGGVAAPQQQQAA
jgi:hypothetical protein